MTLPYRKCGIDFTEYSHLLLYYIRTYELGGYQSPCVCLQQLQPHRATTSTMARCHRARVAVAEPYRRDVNLTGCMWNGV